MMATQPGGRWAGGDAGGRERAGDGWQGSGVSTTASGRTPQSSLSRPCPSSAPRSLQRLFSRSRVKAGKFFFYCCCLWKN